ncbi:MAG TPA: hypothetical protein VMI31_09695, partial [Fimbriimonadaceae bacterium]|nr:hypothetical protein [Fimbriimonadaceae bacterium]
MSARKLVFRSMLCAPAVFLVVIGVHGRTIARDYEFVANDPATEAKIQAYVPYVRGCRALLSRPVDPNGDLVRRFVTQWVCGQEQGKLSDLNPISYDDVSTDGLKGQVFESRNLLAGRLSSWIVDSLQKGRVHQAVTDTILFLKLNNVAKWSDFASLYYSATEQRRGLMMLNPYAAK